MPKHISFIILVLAFILHSCKPADDQHKENANQGGFVLLDSVTTGVGFTNHVEDQENFNVLTYRNYYNGAGVAIGDINNDGLADIYFTANMKPNQLYLNKGDFKFDDITQKAGVAGTRYWSTGVTMADVNADGWLDIYVCNSGDLENKDKENELFINNGDLTFTEKAAAYGLNDIGYSTHASFFDYDLDGDLDCYVLNNSYKDPERVELYSRLREKVDSLGGQRLYRNDGNHFTNVSEQAGIYSSAIGFGLGVSVGDVNGDYWPDIYISNDFWERDYLYINQGNGTFKESLPQRMSYTSVSSMGSDIADIDNDGDLDIFSTDMLPPDNYRLKAATRFTEYFLDDSKFRANYHYQFLQNCLQVNDGDGKFLETAFYSGIAATDWSWGALIFDMDLDGRKDIFVSNGVYHDITDLDFIDFIANDASVKKVVEAKGKYDFRDFLPYLPHNKRKNYAFINAPNLKFENKASVLGLDQESYSNGSAYGDLDNDGDYDLVVNNVNMPAFIYRNDVNNTLHNHYIKIKLNGPALNPYGIGTKVELHSPSGLQVASCMMSRGFESSVDPAIIFGLGQDAKIDSVVIIWPDLNKMIIQHPASDTTLTIKYEVTGEKQSIPKSDKEHLLKEVTKASFNRIPVHKENKYNDFNAERLMPHMMSADGPKWITGDVNRDGEPDVILLGAAGDPDKLYIKKGNQYIFSTQPAFVQDSASESVCGALFDAEWDGDLDLLIGVGGNEIQKGVNSFMARFYLNDGKGNFHREIQTGPFIVGQLGCIRPCDFDGDGDMDLFAGSKMIPGNYGMIPRSFFLRNDGQLKFTDITNADTGPMGMVSDAQWQDINGDKKPDLVVVGEWMPITILINDGAELKKSTLIPESNGWWNVLKAVDLDQDGDMDFIAGNWGLDMKFKATPDKPVTMYVNDFDGNKKPEAIIEWYAPEENISYPFHSKMDITGQLPILKKNNLSYKEYASKQTVDLFPKEIMSQSIIKFVDNFQTCILWNDNSTFRLEPMSWEAQLSSVFAIAVGDMDNDSIPDIYLGGNFYRLKPEVGRQDGNHGGYFKGTGKGQFQFISPQQSGIETTGEVRDAIFINQKLWIARNNDSVLVFGK